MGMFGMFGSKKSKGADPVTGEYGTDQVGMMKMLAGMPHMMRKPMMKGRINALLTLPEETRQERIRDMIGAFHSPKVKASSRDSLVTTRIEVIGEMTEDKRRTIIASRRAALQPVPELERADQQVQERVLSKVAAKPRQAFQASWNDLYKKG